LNELHQILQLKVITMYLTYDLPQVDQTDEKHVLQQAREFSVPGSVLKWEVGEFESPSGTRVYGVRVQFKERSGPASYQILDVPAHAINVNIHQNSLPEEYRSALKNVA
jgi:hypothetical protein